MPTSVILCFLMIGRLSWAQSPLPVIVPDQTSSGPSRVLSKIYSIGSPEFAFWSKSAASPSSRERKLAETVIEIQELNDQLRNHEGVDVNRPKIEEKVKKLTEYLKQEQERDRKPTRVKFLKWSKHGNVTTCEVILYSGITDKALNQKLVDIIESRWHIVEGKETFQVKIELRPIKDSALDGAFVTVGAPTTHAELGKAIRFGAGPISENVVAHEFGHILGFKDLYYRFRTGNEVHEVAPVTTDIMGNPEFGRVELRHFLELKKVIGL